MKAKERGTLFVLSGPSGVGKETLRTRALRDIEGLTYSVSCTTRPPRPGDREGVDYRFVSDDGSRPTLRARSSRKPRCWKTFASCSGSFL